jgi:hypothetical protein
LRGESRVEVLVHGLSHANHAPPARKKAEFGADRALSALEADAELALGTAVGAFGSRLLPVFVPPWNRIAAAFVSALPGLGYRGLSTLGNRARSEPVAALAQVNIHFDPIDWHGGRGLLDPERLIAQLATAIADRADRRTDADEPIGLLTHHLVHDEVTWGFCAELLERLSLHDNVRYPLPTELFVVAEASNRDALQGLS